MIRKRMNINKALKTLGIMLTLLFLNLGSKFPAMSESNGTVVVLKSEYPAVMDEYPKMVRQRLHEQLVTEVKTYINKVAPTSKISSDSLVGLCEKYDMDITFVLAQGLIESHFGTKGRAAGWKTEDGKRWLKQPTNSVFNVGTWDGKEALYTYKHPNESIEPYLKLLKNDYLNKRTLRQLLNNGGYINENGHRYASSPTYEQSLRTTIATITMETSIKTYQDVMNLSDEKIIAYFAPEKEVSPGNLTASLK